MGVGASGRLQFLPRLESLRGIAAVAVVGYHVAGLFTDTLVTGMAPVVMFFVLSGFVLARSLQHDDRPIRFLRHRVFRLVPAATAVVVLFALLHHLVDFSVGFDVSGGGRYDVSNIILNALMIRHDINAVMWSLTVECFATPLILLSVWIGRRFGPQPLALLIAVLFAASFVGEYVHLLGGYTNLAPLYAFVAGVLLQMQGRMPAARFGVAAFRIVAVVAVLLLGFSGVQKQTAPIFALEGLSSGLLVWLVAFRSPAAEFGLLDLPLVRFYGRISYSFYLLHPLGVTLAVKLFDMRSLPAWFSIAATSLLAVVLTTPAAWLCWRCVEIPFVALSRRLDFGKPPSAVASASICK